MTLRRFPLGVSGRIMRRSRWIVCAIAAAACIAPQAAYSSNLDGAVGRSGENQQAEFLNQMFHGSFVSPIPDGQAQGTLDADTVPYVPSRKASGYLIVIPKTGNFDSIFVNIVVRRKGKVIGEIRSGIVYWFDGRCVVGFGGMETLNRHVVAVRGFVDVTALSPAVSAGTVRPGRSVFIVPDGSHTFPVSIDHRVNPPSDEQDDD